MRFKMAPNSLFAVLLRSPWWISGGISLAFVAAMHALLPAEYRLMGSMGALPFIVITAVAAWRQLRAPGAAEREAILQAVAAMGWAEFGPLLRQGFERQGWLIQPQAGAAAAAADLRMLREGLSALVAARRWKAARLGEDAVQALAGAMAAQEVAKGVLVALGDVSPNARRLAKAKGIELLEADALVHLLRGLVPKR